jgi:hypothetical protein
MQYPLATRVIQLKKSASGGLAERRAQQRDQQQTPEKAAVQHSVKFMQHIDFP